MILTAFLFLAVLKLQNGILLGSKQFQTSVKQIQACRNPANRPFSSSRASATWLLAF